MKLLSSFLFMIMMISQTSFAKDNTIAIDVSCQASTVDAKPQSLFELIDGYLEMTENQKKLNPTQKILISTLSQLIADCLLEKASHQKTLPLYIAGLTYINTEYQKRSHHALSQKYLYHLSSQLQYEWTQRYGSRLTQANQRNAERGLFSGAKAITILFVLGSAISSLKNLKNVTLFQKSSRLLFAQRNAPKLVQYGKNLIKSGFHQMSKRPITSLAIGGGVGYQLAYGNMPYFPSQEAKDIPIAPAHFLGLDLDLAQESYDHIFLSQKISGYQLLAELTTSILTFGPIYQTVKSSLVTYYRAQKIRRTAQGVALVKTASRGAVLASLGIGVTLLISELVSEGTKDLILHLEEEKLKNSLSASLKQLRSSYEHRSALASIPFVQNTLNLSHFLKRSLFESEMELSQEIQDVYEICHEDASVQAKLNKIKVLPSPNQADLEMKIYQDCLNQNPDLEKKIKTAVENRELKVKEYLRDLPFQYHSDYEEVLVRRYLSSDDIFSIQQLSSKGQRLASRYQKTYQYAVKPVSQLSFEQYLLQIEQDRNQDLAASLVHGKTTTHPNHLLLQARAAIFEFAPSYQWHLADFLESHLIHNNLLLQDILGAYQFTDTGEAK